MIAQFQRVVNKMSRMASDPQGHRAGKVADVFLIVYNGQESIKTLP